MFAQIFETVDDYDNVEKFEENIKNTFDEIICQFKKFFKDPLKLQDFIMDNLLFTIIGCFKTKDAYVVKIFGDGYIITENNKGVLSYSKLYYGSRPPYFAYKYCDFVNENVYLNYDFKTFIYNKKDFIKVGIATDGVSPIAKGMVYTFDNELKALNKYSCITKIKTNRQFFDDDVTIGIFEMGGIKDGKNNRIV